MLIKVINDMNQCREQKCNKIHFPLSVDSGYNSYSNFWWKLWYLTFRYKRYLTFHYVEGSRKTSVFLLFIPRWETVGSPHRLAWYWLQVLEKQTKIKVCVFRWI